MGKTKNKNSKIHNIVEPSRLLCEKGHPIELCTCEPIITEVGHWKKFNKEKPKHGQMILYKERWFNRYIVECYGEPHNEIEWWKPFNDFAPSGEEL